MFAMFADTEAEMNWGIERDLPSAPEPKHPHNFGTWGYSNDELGPCYYCHRHWYEVKSPECEERAKLSAVTTGEAG